MTSPPDRPRADPSVEVSTRAPEARESAEGMPSQDHDVALGQWYWIRSVADWSDEEDGFARGDEVVRLYCVTGLASNHAVLTAPKRGNSTTTIRVRYEHFRPPQVVHEPNPDAVIASKVAFHQAEIARLMERVAQLLSGLGIAPRSAIGHGPAGEAGTGLMLISGARDVSAYKHALVRAKEQELPDLFKQIEMANENMVRWLSAPALAMKAQLEPLRERTKEIEGRIFSVELYAGLTERVRRIADGEAASPDERLHVMQRRLYMDEECLAAYDQGGVDVRDLKDFNDWISRPENRDRLLPFPRTVVAMRIRRHKKEREAFRFSDILANATMAEADKKTFLYLRNGDQVWQLACDLEFGEMLFPDPQSPSSLDGPLMVDKGSPWGWRQPHDRLMGVATYEGLCDEYADREGRVAEWREANPSARKDDQPNWIRFDKVRYRGRDFEPKDWEPLTPDSLEYDAAMRAISDEIASYNRICLIIQGLFDRSPVLHPHPPVRLWDAAGFVAAVATVPDASRALHATADPPDFEDYRRRCNESLAAGSIVVGAEALWLAREAEKENKRIAADWRRDDRRHTQFRPFGDPGPGLACTVSDWSPRRRVGTSRWTREGRGAGKMGSPIVASISWSADEVFNVSAYRPGDFRMFLSDPRTREGYLKWAPLLMAAEDWHAGRLRERPGNAGTWGRAR